MPIEISARIEDGGLLRDLERAPAEARKLARREVKEVSFGTERRIKANMPVLTGRARASWGNWTPGDVRNNPEATRADAHWQESDGGLTISQGSNVDYIADLNEGHSQQAPAGFIDAAAATAQRVLTENIARIVDLFRGR